MEPEPTGSPDVDERPSIRRDDLRPRPIDPALVDGDLTLLPDVTLVGRDGGRVGRDGGRVGSDGGPVEPGGGRGAAGLAARLGLGTTAGGRSGPVPQRTMMTVALIALVPVVAAIGIAIILSLGTGRPTSGGDPGSGGTSTAQDDPSGGTGASTDGGSGSSGSGSNGTGSNGTGSNGSGSNGGTAAGNGISRTSLDDAADALREAGIGRVGAVVTAWSWTDGDRVTTMAVSRLVTRRNSDFSPRAVTLRLTTVVKVADGKATVVATSEDEGQVCPDGTKIVADVRPTDVTVSDLDGDGTREAVVRSVHTCGQDVRKRVTVLAAQGPFVLSGQGAVIAEPDPPQADWPSGFIDAATTALDA